MEWNRLGPSSYKCGDFFTFERDGAWLLFDVSTRKRIGLYPTLEAVTHEVEEMLSVLA